MGLQAIFMLLLKYISKYSIYLGAKQPICRRDQGFSVKKKRVKKHLNLVGSVLINNFVIGLVQKSGYSNLASARRYFDASIASQLFSCFLLKSPAAVIARF